MLGYSLKVSELKEQLSRRITREARGLRGSGSADYLRSALEGKTQSYSSQATPWWCPTSLRDSVEDRGGGGSVIHGSGYPLLLIARGSTIISEVVDVEGSRHGELRALLDPRKLYLVEAWDQS